MFYQQILTSSSPPLCFSQTNSGVKILDIDFCSCFGRRSSLVFRQRQIPRSVLLTFGVSAVSVHQEHPQETACAWTPLRPPAVSVWPTYTPHDAPDTKLCRSGAEALLVWVRQAGGGSGLQHHSTWDQFFFLCFLFAQI
ncbi:hypothetical protein WMY93_030665 [Mugilogobius chulae]|uniref:Uncharacterized protein n=1 Tax=Mugilogobius chulae TaxID=88201 RepID=A0AAW0MMJ6_9GOBI